MQTVIHRPWPLLAFSCCLFTFGAPAWGQDAPKALPVESVSAGNEADAKEKGDLSATLLTQKEARTMRLSIPAPRGQIVDRNGIAFASNRAVNYLALNFPFMENATPEKILAFAKGKI